MDLIDDPVESIITAVFEIPGIKTNDISLHISDGYLVVSGERRATYNITQPEVSPQETAEDGTQAPKLIIPIQELRFGTFRRAVRIPDGLKVRVPILNPPRTLHIPSLSFSIELTQYYFYRRQKSKLASTKVC